MINFCNFFPKIEESVLNLVFPQKLFPLLSAFLGNINVSGLRIRVKKPRCIFESHIKAKTNRFFANWGLWGCQCSQLISQHDHQVTFYKEKKLSIQTAIKEMKSVALEVKEMEPQKNHKLMKTLSISANQISIGSSKLQYFPFAKLIKSIPLSIDTVIKKSSQ